MQEKASLNRLQLSNFKLDALLRITLAINENMPVDKLLEKFQSILCDDLNIGKVLMFSLLRFGSCWLLVLRQHDLSNIVTVSL